MNQSNSPMIMTTIKDKLFSIVTAWCALLLLAATIALGQPGQRFPYVLQYELGDSEFAPGDSITIEGLQGTTGAIQPGGSFIVTGTYTLESQEEADLSFFATTTNRTPTPIDPEQTVRVKKGAGSFSLIKKMTSDGYLHLTFYSRATGQGFGGVYFGQGQWVLRNKQFSYSNAASQRQETAAPEQTSNSGPNQVLFNYLGNPVVPPPNMDAAYSREGLIGAMETAAQNAGISLVKVEIDDSEFPFLVGVVFARPGDKEKLKEQIVKSGTYSSTGGVGGDINYAMNIVPYNAFPRESGQRIHRRMMLRESILYDRITGAR
jgi:hypothetical protein